MKDEDGIRSDIAELIYLCRAATNLSILPASGGLLDQDFVFVKALGIVQHADAEKARIEQQRKK